MGETTEKKKKRCKISGIHAFDFQRNSPLKEAPWHGLILWLTSVCPEAQSVRTMCTVDQRDACKISPDPNLSVCTQMTE